MIQPSPPEGRSPSKGNWFRQALARLEEYRGLERGKKAAFIASFSGETGRAPNTCWRQFAALDYLAQRRIDLAALGSRPPALMAIEAVARIARADPRREEELLRALVSGEGTIEFFRREAAKIAKRTEPVSAAPTLRLSDLLFENLFRSDFYADPRIDWALRVEFPSGGPASPFLIVEQFLGSAAATGCRARTTWIFRVEASDPKVTTPHFQELLDRAVLHSLLSVDHVIVCADLELPVLRETVEKLRHAQTTQRVEGLAPLTLCQCTLDIDLEPPRGEDRWHIFESARDYFARYTRIDGRSPQQFRQDRLAFQGAYSTSVTYTFGDYPRRRF